MKKRYALTAVMLVLSLFTYGQDKTISGKVSSSADGSALPFVSVAVKGTTKGVNTDIDGNYKIAKVFAKDSLVFSFVGFETKTMLVGSLTTLDIQLTPTVQQLEAVEVTALGVTRQSREVGYATQKLDGEDILKSNTSNIVSAISGKSAGVQVSNANGIDGGTTRIVIRGNNNFLTTNQPLIVVDGIPMENSEGMGVRAGNDWGSAINNLNPEDIEEMNILPGGSASALYGSRGANGVIMITMKKGKARKGIGVTYNVTTKLTTPYRYREVQNKYGGGAPLTLTAPEFPVGSDGIPYYQNLQHTDQLVLNQNGDVSSTSSEFGYYGSAVSWGPEMNGQTIRWWDGSMRQWSPQEDNLKLPFKNGLTTTHNIAAEGGTEKANTRLSLTRTDSKPIVSNCDYSQTTINSNSNFTISKRISTNISLQYINYNRLNSPTLGESENSFSKGLLYCFPRSYQGEDMENYENGDGSRNERVNYPYAYIDPYLWWNYNNNNTTLDRNKFVGGITINYDILPWLKATGRTGIDYGLDEWETKNKPTDPEGKLYGYYGKSLGKSQTNNSEIMLTAFKDSIFGSKLNLRFSAGTGTFSQNNHGLSGHSGTWYYSNMYSFANYTSGDPDNPQFNYPDDVRPSESVYRRKTNSIFAFLNLSYKNYLFLELTGRNDWSSTLPADNNSYFYPSASVSFVLSDAFHFTDSWINFCKVRLGAAQTASDCSPYETYFQYNSYLVNGMQAVTFPSPIPPVGLKPQRVNSYEAGLSTEFLKGRIEFDFTYYYKYSFDQIVPGLPIPTSSGASSVKINNGTLSNQGIEATINSVLYDKKNHYVKLGLNLTRNKNKVISLGEEGTQLVIGDLWGLNGPAQILQAGDDYGTISGYDYLYDEDGNKLVNDEGTKYLITDTRVPIGNASPDFLWGLTGSYSFRNLSISALIDSKIGGDIYCGTYVISMQTGQSPSTLEERDGGGLPYTDPDGVTSNTGVILEGVHEDGTENTEVVHYYYKYMPNYGGWGKFVSTPGILDNTWIKLREVTVSYNIPKKFVGKLQFLQELSLNFVCRDVCYLYSSLPDKINPEGINGSGNAQGFEWASLPGTRSYSFGLKAKF